MNLFEASERFFAAAGITKDRGYYRIYDNTFRNKGFTPKSMLEIGVYQGASTKTFATVYPELKIVALDLVKRDIDFGDSEADQGDQARLRSLCQSCFPDGIDLVIEDGAHISQLSRLSFEAMWPFLREGGLYIIEDWDTGYWDDWPDGSHYQNFPTPIQHGQVPRRLPSHDYGMVGFVKSLLDVTSDIRPKTMAPYMRNRWIRELTVCQGIAIAEKD